MGRGQVITKRPLLAITQAPTPRAMAALHAATLTVPIDLIFRFSDYRALLHVLPVFGDYVVKRIPTPPDEGWGVSRSVGNGTKAE